MNSAGSLPFAAKNNQKIKKSNLYSANKKEFAEMKQTLKKQKGFKGYISRLKEKSRIIQIYKILPKKKKINIKGSCYCEVTNKPK